MTTMPAVAAPGKPDAERPPAPAYPVPAPNSGDDPRFCFGLTYDVAKVLHQYGYPPVQHGRDFFQLQQALFRFIYRQEEVL